MGASGHLGPFLSFPVLLSPCSLCLQPGGCWSWVAVGPECLCPRARGTRLLRVMSLLKAAAAFERCVLPLGAVCAVPGCSSGAVVASKWHCSPAGASPGSASYLTTVLGESARLSGNTALPQICPTTVLIDVLVCFFFFSLSRVKCC